MESILAFDVGTSGTKAAVVDRDGKVIATAYHPYPTAYPKPQWAEQNPEDWWQALAITTPQVLAAAKIKANEILGIAFSTQMVNTIPVDRQGTPLRSCISWLDGRAEEEAIAVMRKLGGKNAFALIVGATLTGKDLLPKYLWLKRYEPEIYQKAFSIIDCSGYLLARATGRLAYEWSVASVTGMFNLKTKDWDEFLIRFFGLDRSKFPDLVQPSEKVGGLTTQAAAQLGLVEGIPVFGGAGDAMTAAVGSGAVGESEGHLCLGTSGFVGIVTSRKVVGKKGIPTIQSADPAKLLLVAETETSGECLKWAAKALFNCDPAGDVFRQMDLEVETVSPGANGLLFTPWLYGERCPVADERVRAGFYNLGANHSRAHMLRAIYEGVGYNMRWILDNISELFGFRPDPLRVMGGGAKGLPWVQIVADITGRTLECVPNPQETTALGAALVAAVGLGIFPNIEATKAVVPVQHRITPNESHRQKYENMFTEFKQIYPAIKNIYHLLNTTE